MYNPLPSPQGLLVFDPCRNSGPISSRLLGHTTEILRVVHCALPSMPNPLDPLTAQDTIPN